jgi:hypothetical protein
MKRDARLRRPIKTSARRPDPRMGGAFGGRRAAAQGLGVKGGIAEQTERHLQVDLRVVVVDRAERPERRQPLGVVQVDGAAAGRPVDAQLSAPHLLQQAGRIGRFAAGANVGQNAPIVQRIAGRRMEAGPGQGQLALVGQP